LDVEFANDRPSGVTSVVAVGHFDGVHLGHQAVLRQLTDAASRLGTRAAVVLLRPGRGDISRPGGSRPESSRPDGSGPERTMRISTLDQTLELLAARGVDTTLVLGEEDTGAALAQVVVETLGATLLVSGDDPAPDRARPATEPGLRSVPVHRVPAVRLAAGAGRPELVTAERIMGLLLRGAVDQAANLLGRPYEVRGIVSHGDARGRTLGFPTANIPIPADLALPGDGVYAGHYIRSNGDRYPTAISLGRRPTFYELRGTRLLEAHLLDFDGDLYGELGTVAFERRLRRQRKFDSGEALVAQLHLDVARTRAVAELRERKSAPGDDTATGR
jgi:riboflavin kinase/FMN adenylyltransferase